jgi:tRNA uridine 5-carboxymethylaminomethyl modification enzyme
MYSGQIAGIGPRYCPSIEDKIVKFPDKTQHQFFLEPEGLHTHEVYVNGMSTSLPMEVQWEIVRSIPGMEAAEMLRPGYAIEYDSVDATELDRTLRVKSMEGLYLAGQINGTSGYEEAACQGIMAGINAALMLKGEPPFTLDRSEGYTGVLIDDLISMGINEPYRMFTSRAEHRLSLRHDNADLRLTRIGAEMGLASPERIRKLRAKQDALTETRRLLGTLRREGQSLSHLLKRNDVTWTDLPSPFQSVDADVASQLETEIKYEGYLRREEAHIERNRADEDRTIPDWIDFDAVPGLKAEARVKLKRIQPRTFGQAARISGINPTDVALLQVHTKRGKAAAALVK